MRPYRRSRPGRGEGVAYSVQDRGGNTFRDGGGGPGASAHSGGANPAGVDQIEVVAGGVEWAGSGVAAIDGAGAAARLSGA